MKKLFWKSYGYIFIRPIRHCFWKMVCNYNLRLMPTHEEYFGWRYPNFHWWALYWTVFKFCKWLNYEAWRLFCDWTGGWRQTYPWIARVIHKIGQTTAGYAISGGECYHCASDDGCQVDLSQDETGETFRLTRTGETATEDGTDYWFEGITICPVCGYEAEYSDGSL